MTAAELCREAARLVATRGSGWYARTDGACWALTLAAEHHRLPIETQIAARRALHMLAPLQPEFKFDYWWPCEKSYRGVRVLALLFAAAMLEDEK